MKSKKVLLCLVAITFAAAGALGWWVTQGSLTSSSALTSPQDAASTLAEKRLQANLNRLRVEGIKPAAKRSVSDGLTDAERTARQIARPTLRTSLLNLDLSRAPTELELIQAGQLGDPLSPTSSADPDQLQDPLRKEWQRNDNLEFGKAIQAWNEHRYDAAIEMFTRHATDHPDSPWAAESRLHIGCAAQYRGEYDICYDQFGRILDTTKKGTDIHQKALLRTANILTMQGMFSQAASTYAEALRTETNINRAGYASSWLPILSIFEKNEAALRDCVQKSLREICAVKGMEKEAKAVEAVSTLSSKGFTAAQVLELCRHLGLDAQAIRSKTRDVRSIPTPYLAHYSDAHFVAVFEAGDHGLRIYDSRVGFQREIDHNSFKAQWSGFAIALGGRPAQHQSLAVIKGNELDSIFGGCCGIMAPAFPFGSPTDEKSPCASGPTGEPFTNGVGAPPSDPNVDSMASPSWGINPVSMNMTVRDVPIWWNSPYGLNMRFSLTFNSQDTLNAIRPFGPRWVLNYCAYAMEDPSGKVTIVGGNGRQWAFTPDGSGGYTAPADFNCTLVKTGTYEFELTYLENDTVYKYGRPGGVSTSASLFTEVVDKWGVSIEVGYNSLGAITSVTHSLGGTWDLIYTSSGDRVERIDDPFGRSAYFSYDSNDDLREVTDMGGLQYSFRYSTSANPVNATPASSMYMTEIIYAPQEISSIDDPNRTWYPLTYQFLTEPPDGNSAGTWETYKVTVLHPSGGKEIHFYDGIDTGSFKSPEQVAAGAAGTSFTYSIANSMGHIATIAYPLGGTAQNADFNSAGVPLSLTGRQGIALTYTVNSNERNLTISDPESRVTSFEYESNGLDLKKVTGPDAVVDIEITRDSQRLPIEALYRDGSKLATTYNSVGQLDTVTAFDAAAATVHTDVFAYDSSQRLETVERDSRTVATYTYDALSRIHTVTDEEGATLTYEYDDLNRVTRIDFPNSTYVQVSYNPVTGMTDWVRNRNGQRTLYFYGRSGRLVGVRAPGNRSRFFNYNLDGKLIEIVDANGSSTKWEYDLEGRIVRRQSPDGAEVQFVWNNKNQLTETVSRRGLRTIYSYDSSGRVDGISYKNAAGATLFPDVAYSYDTMNRVVSLTDNEGTTTYDYDANGRIETIDGPYGSDTVGYTYDDVGRIASLTTPGGVVESISYDAEGRPETWTGPFGDGGATYSAYTGRMLTTSISGGILTSSYDYTPVNDLQKLEQISHEMDGNPLSQFDYSWSPRQQIANFTRTLGTGATRQTLYSLQYDLGSRLVGSTLAQVSDSTILEDKRWGFDAGDNRSYEHDLMTATRTSYAHGVTNGLVDRKTFSSGQKPWVKGNLNEPGSVAIAGKPAAVQADNTFQGESPSRIAAIDAKDTAGNTSNEVWQLNSGSGSTPDSSLSYTSDDDGNLLGDGVSTFEWDLKNRLTAIVTGTHRTEYYYDGSNRRIRVVEKESGSVQSDLRYVYAGQRMLEQRASNNSTVNIRFYGNGHVDVADGGKRYVYTNDHLGSIREVVLLDGTSGNATSASLAARYDYDMWGNRTVLDGGSAAEDLVQHGFTGHIYHRWSGVWIAPYRVYSPLLGRWLSRDPIGFQAGTNSFAYVHNQPMGAIDPLGLQDFNVITGPQGELRRDFIYRNAYAAYYGQQGLPVTEEGYAAAMNSMAAYQQAYGIVSSVYGFGGASAHLSHSGPLEPEGIEAEAIVLVGVDVSSGESYLEGLLLAGGEVQPGKSYFAGVGVTDGHIEPIMLAEGPFGGLWSTGEEFGFYFFGEFEDYFAGFGAAFKASHMKNLLSGAYWRGELPNPPPASPDEAGTSSATPGALAKGGQPKAGPGNPNCR